MTPESTMNREPFIHAHSIVGSVENASVTMILRAFSEDEIAHEKRIIESITKSQECEEPRLKVTLEFKEQYKNMRTMAEPHACVKALEQAVASIGLAAEAKPIRGGTDGARLSFMGVPCPNIFTGGSNFHSVSEWTSLENMAQATATLVALLPPIIAIKKGS
jgi:tripeptide aminopeptidase